MVKILKLLEVGGIIIKVNNRRNGIFKSFSTKLSFIIAFILIMSLLMILIANSLFLEKYYVNNNRNIFIREYEDIKSQFSEPNADILEILRTKDSTTGFLFYIADISSLEVNKIILASNPNVMMSNYVFNDELEPSLLSLSESGNPMLHELGKPMLGETGNPMLGELGNPMIESFPLNNIENPHRGVIPKIQADYILENIEVIENEGYIFSQVFRDINGNEEFDLVFGGELDNDYLLLIIRPVEQLSEQISIINKFLFLIGLISLLISIIVANLLAKSVVKPIKEITKIGKKISNLDFSNIYIGNSRDEIGDLGNSINEISYQLDAAIRGLEESNKKLEIEMNLQKKFFAGISHEFKTPIGLISGYTETIKLGLAKNPKELEEYTNIILEETNKLNHLVNDILFLIKSESTEFILEKKAINIIDLINISINKYDSIVMEDKIDLIKDYPDEIMVSGDKIRVNQIFDNILSNAFRYTKKGKKIIITAEKKGSNVLIKFINEGPQIKEEHITHLFDPFYSAYESRDRFSSGTGLGLSIVKNLVDKHNGQIEIVNVEEDSYKGVMVTILLPLINK